MPSSDASRAMVLFILMMMAVLLTAAACVAACRRLVRLCSVVRAVLSIRTPILVTQNAMS